VLGSAPHEIARSPADAERLRVLDNFAPTMPNVLSRDHVTRRKLVPYIPCVLERSGGRCHGARWMRVGGVFEASLSATCAEPSTPTRRRIRAGAFELATGDAVLAGGEHAAAAAGESLACCRPAIHPVCSSR